MGGENEGLYVRNNRIKKMRVCVCLTDRMQATRRIEAYMYMSACLSALFVRELLSR